MESNNNYDGHHRLASSSMHCRLCDVWSLYSLMKIVNQWLALMRRGNTWWCMESLGLESSVLLTSVSGSHHASLTGNALLRVLFRSSSFTAQPAAVLPRSTSHSCRRRPSTDTAATATARYIHHRPQPACLYASRLSVNSIVIASVSCVFLYFSCLYTLYCYYNVFVTVHAWPALMGA